MTTTTMLLQVLTNGILLGGVYALLAVGLNLVFGVMRVINFAHGEFLVIGGLASQILFARMGWNPLLSLVVIFPLMFLLGVMLQRFLVERVVHSPQLMTAILLYGVSVAVSKSGVALLGPEYRSVRAFTGSILLADIAIAKPRLVAFLVAVSFSAVLYLVLRYSKLGRAMRATAQSGELAVAIGINVKRVRQMTFGLAAALTAAAGALMIMSYPMSPDSGAGFMLRSFAVVVIGGLGSTAGAVAGAILLALVEVFTSFALDAQIAEIALYLMFILVLLVRPSGLMGERSVQ